MFFTKPAAVVAASALLLSLAGCGVGDGGGDAGSPTACITDKTWVLDIDDMAAQLADRLSSNGLNVTQSEGSGRQTFEFASDGSAVASIDLTYTITVNSSDGLDLTLVQTHAGEPNGDWAWVGDTSEIAFTSWNSNGYSIQNTMLVNGVASSAPIDIPSDTLGGTNMTAECSGSTLTTQVDGSPFINHWVAEG